jgi:hypothetical protein
MARFDHRRNNQAILLLFLLFLLLALCGCGGGTPEEEPGAETQYCPVGGDGVGPPEPVSLRNCGKL